ncbi:MAG: glycoside hydrolase family 3 N-terminal domain-containing protein, partial [Deferribacterota bacterium]|nr:glycoside hydrolase family 3 N-terminal domain-containing protein [Deferribacterota bacterium]
DAKIVQEIATNETSLKIPLLLGKDAIHGHALYPNGTVFPMPLGLASSFDDEIMRKSATVTATEMTATGLNWNFSPILDVARDPRWGRIIETFGEDPYLVYRMGLGKIKGYQGDNLNDKNSVLATGKHFVAYSETTGGRDYSSADISERTLYDIFLPSFKGAVDNGIASIMTSFNDINGVPATGNVDLVRRTLKDQWNFNGIVISDYNSVAMLYHTQFVAENARDAAKMAINAGVDVEMTSTCYLDNLVKLVNSGEVSIELLDDAVRRVLRAKFLLGLFDSKKTLVDESILNNEEHKKIVLEAARKTLVLLKNENNTLPQNIENIKKIAVIGPLADDAQNQLGGWTMSQPRQNIKTVLDGIKSVAGDKVEVVYEKGVNITEEEIEGVSSGGGVEDLGLGSNMSDESFEDAINAAENSDIIVAVMGESADMSSEPNSRAYLDIPGRQEELLKALYETGIPIVLVLINGRPLTINWEVENIPAIIEAWFPGQEGGLAIAEAIFGKVNPSGKLPVTFPKTIGQIPLWYYHTYQKNWGGQESYGNRYVDIDDEPLFPFGHGLSYTTFDYSELTTEVNSDTLKISFNVQNIGNLAGTEIAQLYIRDVISSLVPINKKLYRFKRINLQPGETKRISFIINKSELAVLNSEGRRVFEPGEFNILVGSSSSDIKLKNSIYF